MPVPCEIGQRKLLRKESSLTHIDAGFERHEFRCPHCEKQTVFQWAGTTVLFSPATCQHCAKLFVIVDNEPRK